MELSLVVFTSVLKLNLSKHLLKGFICYLELFQFFRQLKYFVFIWFLQEKETIHLLTFIHKLHRRDWSKWISNAKSKKLKDHSESESEREYEHKRESESDREYEHKRESESERDSESEREREYEHKRESDREYEHKRESERESESESESEREYEHKRESESESESESNNKRESVAWKSVRGRLAQVVLDSVTLKALLSFPKWDKNIGKERVEHR